MRWVIQALEAWFENLGDITALVALRRFDDQVASYRQPG